jgi:hypothetical protein
MPIWLDKLVYGGWLALIGLALAFIPAFLLRWMETLWSSDDAAIHYSLWGAVVEAITNPSSLAVHMGAVIGAGILTVVICSGVRYAWEANRDKWSDT